MTLLDVERAGAQVEDVARGVALDETAGTGRRSPHPGRCRGSGQLFSTVWAPAPVTAFQFDAVPVEPGSSGPQAQLGSCTRNRCWCWCGSGFRLGLPPKGRGSAVGPWTTPPSGTPFAWQQSAFGRSARSQPSVAGILRVKPSPPPPRQIRSRPGRGTVGAGGADHQVIEHLPLQRRPLLRGGAAGSGLTFAEAKRP